MHKRRPDSFTLVELLVVIAVISLLMGILLPVLTRVRRQVKATICRSNLRQWGTIFLLYAEDNEGYFTKGACSDTSTGFNHEDWTTVLRPYYTEPKIRFCPMSKKSQGQKTGGTFSAWGPLNFEGPDGPTDYGSYGINDWLCNPERKATQMWGHATKNNWRTIDVKGAANIPMFLDCVWLGGYPEPHDKPPEYDGHVSLVSRDEMRRYCLNRHDGVMNGVFLDSSVKRIGLKCLWRLKWHRNFNKNGEWTPRGECTPEKWAKWGDGWMKKLPECDW